MSLSAENELRLAPRRKWAARFSLAAGTIVSVTALCAYFVLSMNAQSHVHMPDPLAPPDTSTPQATLECVRGQVAEGARIISAAFERHIQSPGLFATPETRDATETGAVYISRAMRCVDLSGIAPANREKVGTERVLMLAEVLERLPRVDAPGARDGVPLPDRWTVPKTEIQIARATVGARAGEYLFTADTIERVRSFYSVVSELPDQDRFDFYKFYSLSPGHLMPPKWFGLLRLLPTWALAEYGDQAAWQWIAYVLILVLFGSLLVALIVAAHGRFLRSRLSMSYRRLVAPLGIMCFASLAHAAITEINITGAPYTIAETGLLAVIYVSAAWLLLAAALSLSEWTANASGLRPRSIDAGMLRLLLRLLGIAAGASVLSYGASELGVPLVGIVAGLGIGGVAIALAAQPTIENLIGGFMIYADRPVRVGDQCKFGDITGVVEEIGIRSTRIRAVDRTVITVPNGDFSKQRLTNVDRRDRLVVSTKIGLQYGTTEAQLKEIVVQTSRLFERHPRIEDKRSSLRLFEFGALSVELELVAELTSCERDELPLLRQEILMGIAGIVENAGTSLAERIVGSNKRQQAAG